MFNGFSNYEKFLLGFIAIMVLIMLITMSYRINRILYLLETSV